MRLMLCLPPLTLSPPPPTQQQHYLVPGQWGFSRLLRGTLLVHYSSLYAITSAAITGVARLIPLAVLLQVACHERHTRGQHQQHAPMH
jgi:hypothetical protein